MALTAKRVARVLKHPGRYPDGHGLYLQVVNPKNASWLLRYERDGRGHWHGLGPLHVIGLAAARERAKAARLQLLDGIDPIAAKKAAKAQRALLAAKALTFKEAAERYRDQHEGKWKNHKHRQQFSNTLRQYAYPVLGSLPVAEIDTGLVLKCIEPIWKDRTETASRVRGRVEAILDWCTVRGYRSGDNPARWRGHLNQVLAARSQLAKPVHHAALAYRELPAFMAALREREGTAARALEFCILTAARTGEVIGARWPEINFEERVWTVPPTRMKGGREHKVPLPSEALALLRSLPREQGNSFVFLGSRSGSGLSNTTLSVLIKRVGRPDITTHGMRSCFRTWCSEQTNFPNEVCELALAHAIGDKVEAAYRRGDLLRKRRLLAESWSRFCCSPAQSGKTVVPIRG